MQKLKGRPPSTAEDKEAHLRLDKEHRKRLMQLAKMNNLTLTATVRALIDRGLGLID